MKGSALSYKYQVNVQVDRMKVVPVLLNFRSCCLWKAVILKSPVAEKGRGGIRKWLKLLWPRSEALPLGPLEEQREGCIRHNGMVRLPSVREPRKMRPVAAVFKSHIPESRKMMVGVLLVPPFGWRWTPGSWVCRVISFCEDLGFSSEISSLLL